MQFRGTWSSFATYNPNDVVIYRGDAYITSRLSGFFDEPPRAPWTALSASSTAATDIRSLRQTIASQSNQIALLKSQVDVLQKKVTEAVSGFQTLNMTATALELSPRGSAVPFTMLLSRLLDIPIKIGSLDIMAFRSVLSRLLTSIAATEAKIEDVSGYAHTAIAAEASARQAAVSALEGVDAVLTASQAATDARVAAEEAATQLQALKDAAQDAAATLNELNDSAVAASVSALSSSVDGISGRVAALESAPGFDAAPLQAAIADVSGAIAAEISAREAAILDVSGAVAAEIAAREAADSAAVARLDALDLSASGAASRLDAIEPAVASKVAQSDYDMHVASIEAAVAQAQASADGAASAAAGAQSAAAGAQSAADAAASTASAAQTAVADKEDKGEKSAIVTYDLNLDTVGIENMQMGVPWQTTVQKSADGFLVVIKTVLSEQMAFTNVPSAPTAGSKLFARFVCQCPGGLALKDGTTLIAEVAEGDALQMIEHNGAWVFVQGA